MSQRGRTNKRSTSTAALYNELEIFNILDFLRQSRTTAFTIGSKIWESKFVQNSEHKPNSEKYLLLSTNRNKYEILFNWKLVFRMRNWLFPIELHSRNANIVSKSHHWWYFHEPNAENCTKNCANFNMGASYGCSFGNYVELMARKMYVDSKIDRCSWKVMELKRPQNHEFNLIS